MKNTLEKAGISRYTRQTATKLTAFILTLILFFALTGCGKSDYSEIKWSSLSLGEKLPVPSSPNGKINIDSADSLSITIGNTSKSDYEAYVEKCEAEYGFTVDKIKTDTNFSASNSDKYSLHIYFYADEKEMRISLSLYKDIILQSTSTATATASAYEASPTPQADVNDKTDGEKQSASDLVDGMHKEFKDAMDSYESFMDEYIAFMKKYAQSNGTDMSILKDYAEYLKKYKKAMEDFDKWNETEMNEAETKYYLEVQGRITKKQAELLTY